MLAKKMKDAFNSQMNAELYSAYLYLSMAAYFESKNLTGFAHWLKVQTQEETVHALKFFNYIRDRGAAVKLKAIDGPATEWADPQAAFEAVLKHEQKVTGLINNLVEIAIAEKDHAAKIFLDWFVNEQVEEESSALAVLEKIKMVADNTAGLYALDKEMGARVFNLPPDMAEWAPASLAAGKAGG